jgi:hypothetical protein
MGYPSGLSRRRSEFKSRVDRKWAASIMAITSALHADNKVSITLRSTRLDC